MERLSGRGGDGGVPNVQDCDLNSAVRYISFGIIDKDQYVYEIRLSCFRPADGQETRKRVFGGTWRPGWASTVGGRLQPCPGSEYATGLSLRYGRHINAIGLICDTFHSDDDGRLFPPPSRTPGPGMESNTDRPGSDRHRLIMDDPEVCRLACVNDRKQDKRDGCRAWTYVKPGVQDARGVCYLKNPAPNPVPNTCCISGKLPRELPREP
jgi:hypothetical protein